MHGSEPTVKNPQANTTVMHFKHNYKHLNRRRSRVVLSIMVVCALVADCAKSSLGIGVSTQAKAEMQMTITDSATKWSSWYQSWGIVKEMRSTEQHEGRKVLTCDAIKQWRQRLGWRMGRLVLVQRHPRQLSRSLAARHRRRLERCCQLA